MWRRSVSCMLAGLLAVAGAEALALVLSTMDDALGSNFHPSIGIVLVGLAFVGLTGLMWLMDEIGGV